MLVQEHGGGDKRGTMTMASHTQQSKLKYFMLEHQFEEFLSGTSL